MRKEDLRVVASLVDWSDSNKILNKVFYERYGKILEEKLSSFQECKFQMKDCIKNNYGESMIPRTPKRAKPMASLLEQIHQFKTICFDIEDVENSPSRSLGSPADVRNELPHVKAKEAQVVSRESTEVVLKSVRAEIENLVPIEPTNPYLFNEPSNLISAFTSSASGTAKMVTRSKFATKKAVKQSARNAKSPSSKVLRHSARQQKIKYIEEKTNQALKYKEDLLKEKAERAKRDREEHRQRVEQNNRLKEAEQRGREQQLRAQEKRLHEFRQEQERVARNAGQSKSPFRVGLGVYTLPKTTPRQLVVPTKRSKNTEINHFRNNEQHILEENFRIEEEERMREKVEKERQKEEHRQKELLDQELREHELQERKRLEMELWEEKRREHESREQERLLQEKQEVERREKERVEKERREREQRKEQLEKERLEKERLDKERLDKERKEQQLREQTIMEKEQQERDQKFRAVVQHTYDMTPDKIYVPSSENNYNVDDLSSHDETDNDEKPRKEVPKWAQRNTLVKKVTALHKLLSEERRERHFGRLQQPSLSNFFKNHLKQYPLRNSSAIWASPMGDPTPGESRFMNFQVGNNKN